MTKMPVKKITHMELSERDLDFLAEAGAPNVGDKSNLKKVIREDEDFRRSFVGDEKVFRKLMADDESFLSQFD
jgi:hypothetical protein